MKRDDLLLRYTKKHPDVIAIEKTIENIKKRQLANVDVNAEKPTDPALVANPVYQQLQLTLGEAEANLASLRVREKEYQDRVKKLKDMVNTIPAVETELKRLDRDYNVNKKNYNMLVSRRESAKLGEDAGESAESVKFRVIDPPFVGDEPVAPNRPIMMSVVFVASLIAGLAFPLFLSLIKPSVDSVKSLQDLTKLPVLGAVRIVRTPAQVKRRRYELLSFLAMGLMLAFAYAVVMTFTLMDKGLSQIIGGLL
jgi:polysaccharide chain length determinant protein (PEP-CTERM system associated)